MDGRFWHAAALAAVTSLPSATRLKITAEANEGADRFPPRFPKQNRLLRSKDFRIVYDTGSRIAGPLCAAFCLCQPGVEGPRVGFTVPRALGNAVVRNRLRRRFREVVRLRLAQLSKPWWVVINPRRTAIDCAFSDLDREISRIFLRCSKQDC